MARPRKSAPLQMINDLDQKAEILERELSVQRAAMERLKQLASPSQPPGKSTIPPKSARVPR